jgi:ABC-type tungstate transport system permease subunit
MTMKTEVESPSTVNMIVQGSGTAIKASHLIQFAVVFVHAWMIQPNQYCKQNEATS